MTARGMRLKRTKKARQRRTVPRREAALQHSSSSSSTPAMRERIITAIQEIPEGKVSTYGAVACAAGCPGAARQVAAVLHRSQGMPWQRVLGAGGEIKLRGEWAIEQRFRLESEGVKFRGRRVDMRQHGFTFSKGAGARKTGTSKTAGKRKGKAATFGPRSGLNSLICRRTSAAPPRHKNL